MPKVIFVNRFFSPDESATSRLLSDLAFGLSKTGHEIAVITSGQRLEDPDAKLAKRETINGTAVYRVVTTRFGRTNLIARGIDYISFYISAIIQTLAITQRNDTLIVKTDPPMLSVPIRICSIICGANQVNWLQDVFPEIAIRLGLSGRLENIESILIKVRNWSLINSNSNIVIGEAMYRHLVEQGIPKNKLSIIPNWTDAQSITPIPRHLNKLRSEWNLGDSFVLGYSGNLGRAHNYSAILAACRHFKSDLRVKFLFIGGGVGMTNLKEIAATENLTGAVFKPYQPRENLAMSLSAPDVHLVTLEPELEGLIVPSKYYGVAAAGRATIYLGAEDGEIARYISSNRSGITINPSNSSALINFIEKALNEGLESIQAMGARARTAATLEFGFDRALSARENQLATVSNLHSGHPKHPTT